MAETENAAAGLRLTFNEDAANYDRCRPTYAPELFEAVFRYTGLGDGRRALEIGPGTGQATSPFLRAGWRVTAVELGTSLADFARRKFAGEPRLEIVTGDFMTVPPEDGAFDLIYSATAFHWLPREEALARVHRLLRPGGTLALFWNHPFAADTEDPLHAEIQRAYRRWRGSDKPPAEWDIAAGRAYAAMLGENGFSEVSLFVFRRTRELGAKAYSALLDTYSDHRSMEPTARAGLARDITAAIRAHGGTLAIRDTMDLYLAREPAACQGKRRGLGG